MHVPADAVVLLSQGMTRPGVIHGPCWGPCVSWRRYAERRSCEPLRDLGRELARWDVRDEIRALMARGEMTREYGERAIARLSRDLPLSLAKDPRIPDLSDSQCRFSCPTPRSHADPRLSNPVLR